MFGEMKIVKLCVVTVFVCGKVGYTNHLSIRDRLRCFRMRMRCFEFMQTSSLRHGTGESKVKMNVLLNEYLEILYVDEYDESPITWSRMLAYLWVDVNGLL